MLLAVCITILLWSSFLRRVTSDFPRRCCIFTSDSLSCTYIVLITYLRILYDGNVRVRVVISVIKYIFYTTTTYNRLCLALRTTKKFNVSLKNKIWIRNIVVIWNMIYDLHSFIANVQKKIIKIGRSLSEVCNHNNRDMSFYILNYWQ